MYFRAVCIKRKTKRHPGSTWRPSPSNTIQRPHANQSVQLMKLHHTSHTNERSIKTLIQTAHPTSSLSRQDHFILLTPYSKPHPPHRPPSRNSTSRPSHPQQHLPVHGPARHFSFDPHTSFGASYSFELCKQDKRARTPLPIPLPRRRLVCVGVAVVLAFSLAGKRCFLG